MPAPSPIRASGSIEARKPEFSITRAARLAGEEDAAANRGALALVGDANGADVGVGIERGI